MTLPLVLNSVGKSDYGLILLVTSLTGYMGLMTFGGGSALRNHASKMYHAKQFPELNNLLCSMQLFYLIILAVNVVAALALVLLFPSVLSILAKGYDDTSKLNIVFMCLVGMTLVNTFVNGLYSNLLNGIDRLREQQLFEGVYSILYTLLYVGFLLFKPSVSGIAIFLLAASIVNSTLRISLTHLLYKEFRLCVPKKIVETLRTVGSSSFFFFLSGILCFLAVALDNVMISSLYSVEKLALFAIAIKLFHMPCSALPIANIIWPKVTAHYNSKNYGELRAVLENGLRLNSLLKVGIMIPLLVYSEEIIGLWLGSDKYAGLGLFICAFTIYVLSTYSGICSVCITGTENQKRLLKPVAIEVLINITVSVLLFKLTELGLVAFALGTISARMIIIFMYNRLVIEIAQISIFVPYLLMIAKLSVLTIAMFAAKHLGCTLSSGAGMFVIYNTGVILCYMWVYYKMIANSDERIFIKEKLFRFLRLNSLKSKAMNLL